MILRSQLRRATTLLFTLFAFVTVIFAYQNCSPVRLVDTNPVAASKSDNGGPYSGLEKLYQRFDSLAPCGDKDLNDKALPNTQVVFKANKFGQTAPYLSRENCTDIAVPTVIADQDITVDPNTTKSVLYRNRSLSAAAVTDDFSVVRASCPAGKSEIPGALRTNSLLNSMNWMEMSPSQYAPGWRLFDGIGVNLFSTIQSLPAYEVFRNDQAHLEVYNREGQYVQLKPSTAYAVSFVAQAGQATGADVNIYRRFTPTPSASDETILATFDFATGRANLQYAVNLTGVSVSMTPFGSGYLCTVYFDTSSIANSGPMDIGFGPTTYSSNPGKVGDSIVGTAAQLVEVNQYCK